MVDPKKALENLRRSQYRVDVMDWLIELAVTPASDKRTALDEKIWRAIQARGAILTADESAERKMFCRGLSDFESYARLVEAKLAMLTD